MRRWAGRIGITLFVVALVNFCAFLWHTRSIGGSAGNGKREGERYFVGNAGNYTEVTERCWRLSRAHEIAVYVTHPLAILVTPLLIAYSESASRKATEPLSRPTDGNGTESPGTD